MHIFYITLVHAICHSEYWTLNIKMFTIVDHILINLLNFSCFAKMNILSNIYFPASHSRKDKLLHFRDITKSLPGPNYDTLKFLLIHLLK